MHSIVEIAFSKSKNTAQLGNATFGSPSQNIGAIIRGYKGATTKQLKILSAERDKEKARDKKDREENKSKTDKGETGKGELQFAPMPPPTLPIIPIGPEDKVWQRNYYEHIIRDERAYQNIANYIGTNPLRWKEDKFFRK